MDWLRVLKWNTSKAARARVEALQARLVERPPMEADAIAPAGAMLAMGYGLTR